MISIIITLFMLFDILDTSQTVKNFTVCERGSSLHVTLPDAFESPRSDGPMFSLW